jgi:hypothetical protein
MEQRSHWYGICSAIKDILADTAYTYNFVGYAGTKMSLGDVINEQSANGRNIDMTFWSDFPYHNTESARKQLESLLVVPANGISEESLTKLTGRSSNWANTIVALANSKVKNLDKAAVAMIDSAVSALTYHTSRLFDNPQSLANAVVILIRFAVINQMCQERYQVEYKLKNTNKYGIDLVNASIFHFKQKGEKMFLTDEPLGRLVLSDLIKKLDYRATLEDSIRFHANVLNKSTGQSKGAYFENLVATCLCQKGTMAKLSDIAVSKDDPQGTNKDKYKWIAKMTFTSWSDHRLKSIGANRHHKQHRMDITAKNEVVIKDAKNCLILPDQSLGADLAGWCHIDDSLAYLSGSIKLITSPTLKDSRLNNDFVQARAQFDKFYSEMNYKLILHVFAPDQHQDHKFDVEEDLVGNQYYIYINEKNLNKLVPDYNILLPALEEYWNFVKREYQLNLDVKDANKKLKHKCKFNEALLYKNYIKQDIKRERKKWAKEKEEQKRQIEKLVKKIKIEREKEV